MRPTKPLATSPVALTRRELLAGLAKTAAGAALLSAGSGVLDFAGAPAAGAAALATVTYQLSYLENVQFGGTYVADAAGYYRQQGLKVDIVPGGSNMAVEPVVESGKALVGNTHTVELAQAVANGADLKVIGAGYQKNPFCVISRADKPIREPSDMIGKKIGVADANQPLFSSFLKGNGIPASKVTVVTVQFDPTPLADGQVDGYVGFFNNEPIELQLEGVKVVTMLMNDHGLPFIEELYIVRSQSLSDPEQRNLITKFMRAEQKGWQATVADPERAAKLAVSPYGAGLKLNLHQQLLEAQAQNQLVADATTAKYGLFWMTAQTVAATLHSLALGGVKIPASTFTDEILKAL
jgi:ABC-type nitrate/sulfonate/bicarbonate transport system substrate-binding protein